MKILIVDDAIFMRKMVRDSLTKGGYSDIFEAADGLEAIKVYKEENPDIVLMDVTMPNMDGLTALREIRAFDSNATVIMCSAMGQENIVIDAIKSGARDFIVKTFKGNRIVEAIYKLA